MGLAMRLRPPPPALAPVLAALLLAGAVATPLAAAGHAPVSYGSTVYVEHVDTAGGTPVRRLSPASRLTRGDRVVTLVNWAASPPARSSGFTLTNALPPALAYQAGGSDDIEVSVDGGHRWGQLGVLRIGGRLALAEDVTNLRWRVPAAVARAGAGRIAYAGVVR